MKLLIFVFLLFSFEIFSQSLLDKLDSDNFEERFEALEIIKNQQLIEYIPELGSRVFSQETYLLQYSFIEALDALEAPNTYDLILTYYNNINTFEPLPPYNSLESKLESKVRAMWLLFKFGDYSKSEDVFDYLNNEPNSKRYMIVINDLKFIYENVPAYQSQALDWILNILNNILNEFTFRNTALVILNQINYSETDALCVSILNDSNENPDLKYSALKILYDRNYPELRTILRNKVLNDPDNFIRFKAGSGLLQVYGVPSDLKLIIDYYPTEPDGDTKGLFQIVVADFVPPKPELNWSELITKLITYTNEMYSYQWIANTQSRDYYITKLNLLNSQITSGRYKDACNTLNKDLLVTIDKDLTTNKITTEGYKFLHYYCVYIKEEFPGPLPCL
ncbi:MAG: hypothetical protein OZ915_10065 [Ignavibacteriales bacterium]|nr:hypothetical protein [Ignavibacteria bacterium]MEB2355510.1 hypothetical protein [Ignavibacteriales bacterium]